MKERAKVLNITADNKDVLLNPKSYIDNNSEAITKAVDAVAKYNVQDGWANTKGSGVGEVLVKQVGFFPL